MAKGPRRRCGNCKKRRSQENFSTAEWRINGYRRCAACVETLGPSPSAKMQKTQHDAGVCHPSHEFTADEMAKGNQMMQDFIHRLHADRSPTVKLCEPRSLDGAPTQQCFHSALEERDGLLLLEDGWVVLDIGRDDPDSDPVDTEQDDRCDYDGYLDTGNDDAESSGKNNEQNKAEVWRRVCFTDVHCLYLVIGGGSQIELDEVKQSFPNLKKLIISDHGRNDYSGYAYDIKSLELFAETLLHLEIRVCGWDCDDSYEEYIDPLTPISKLKNLQHLCITRLPKGARSALVKNVESLHELQSLHLHGANQTFLFDEPMEAPPPECVLDLSKLRKLRSVFLREAEFCSIAEQRVDKQALVLPGSVSCVTIMKTMENNPSSISVALRQELKQLDASFYEGHEWSSTQERAASFGVALH